jgi:hypothetical protein
MSSSISNVFLELLLSTFTCIYGSIIDWRGVFVE